MWQGRVPVPAQMWQGRAPVPAQMWIAFHVDKLKPRMISVDLTNRWLRGLVVGTRPTRMRPDTLRLNTRRISRTSQCLRRVILRKASNITSPRRRRRSTSCAKRAPLPHLHQDWAPATFAPGLRCTVRIKIWRPLTVPSSVY
jgi:hypothetical protein